MDYLNRFTLIFLAVVFVVHVHAERNTISCESDGNSIDLQPHGEDCRQFLVCVQGEGTPITCPNDLYFDAQNKKCQEVNTCDAEPPNPGCHPACVGNESGWVASEENCFDYIECDDSCNAKFKSCSAGLHFNPIHGKCDSADRAECILDVCLFNQNGLWETIGSGNSCSKYYLCFRHEAVLRDCATGTVFDPNTLQCELESTVNCDERRHPFPAPSVIEQCTPLTDLLLIAVPDTENDQFFFQCLNGILTVRQCPKGLFFDIKIMMCNVRSTYDV